MKIASAEFVKSAVNEKGWLMDGLPQIAFVGRSNVGKSSLINRLVNRKGLVKTSGTPGKTREINFFRINGSFYFVDLPGFGYARAPGRVQQEWGPMIEAYLSGCKSLKLVVFLIDIRHEPGKNDMAMQDWLVYYNLPRVYVATKSDKVSKGSIGKQIRPVARMAGVEQDVVIPFSSVTGEGKNMLWDAISSVL
ncbi:MAG TPA: ribosome biogenesis GTP-binding protein YihA/YsxC [Nitrospirota bacterium]|jgi:GTP-binding protein